MSIFNWFNKIFGIENPRTQISLPPEFQLPIENNDYNRNIHNDPFRDLNEHMTQFENLFQQLELIFSSDDENNHNIILSPNNIESDVFNQSLNENDSKIPKQNFLARNHFLNSDFIPQRTLNEFPAEIKMPKINFEQKNKMYYFGMQNGRKIEKEVSTRQLPDGITEKVIVLKDGDQQCVTTITENAKTGLKNCNKELFNLDESQLNEFENRFSKFR